MKMNEKKNIDRLFQEKFKDFEATPSDAVWEKIKAQQQQKRKRVLIPLWYKVGGIAALIALLFTAGTTWLTNESQHANPIVNNNTPATLQNKKEASPNKQTPSTQVVEADHNSQEETRNRSNTVVTPHTVIPTGTKKRLVQNTSGTTQNSIHTAQKEHPSNTIVTTADHSNTDQVAATQQSSSSIASKTPEKRVPNSIIVHEDNSIAKDTSSKEDKIAHHQKNTDNEIAKQPVSSEHPIPKEDTSLTTTDEVPTTKKSILEAAIAQQEAKTKKETPTPNTKRWNIAPVIAPVYYGSVGEGSSIDTKFADNEKQGEVNMSYGVRIACNINDKLSIRSGVNKVALSYNTENVGFGITEFATNDITSEAVPDLNDIKSIAVSDFTPDRSREALINTNDTSLFRSQNPGLLNHNLDYIEIPIEISYAITNKTLGIHMIGGVSTLFLDNENVSIIAGSFENSNIEKEDTVQDVSFSGNLGLGIYYQLSKQFQLSMEPTIKYQFNGFKNSAQDFKPYYFGIYTGVNFNF